MCPLPRKAWKLFEYKYAISISKDRLYGKACRLLVSQGVAPNNESTWNLLVSKHPKGGCPVGLPGAPNDGTLPPDFNLLPVLRSFPKPTGAGPQVCGFNISWMQLRFHFKLQFFTPSKWLSIFCPLVGLLP